MAKIQPVKKKSSPTNLFVRECITTALFELLKTKDFDKITITEIVTRAGVSRMGFYRNFSTKEDVIEQYTFDCFLDTIEEIQKKRHLNFEIKTIMETTLENFQRHAEIMKLFLDKQLDILLLRSYEKAFYHLYDRENISRIRDYSIKMFIGELFNLEMAWVRNGMVETPKQMARIYYKILELRARTQFAVDWNL